MNTPCFVNVYDKSKYPLVFLDAVPFDDYADAIGYMENINEDGMVYCPATLASLYDGRILLVLSFMPNNLEAVSLNEISGGVDKNTFKYSTNIVWIDNDYDLGIH